VTLFVFWYIVHTPNSVKKTDYLTDWKMDSLKASWKDCLKVNCLGKKKEMLTDSNSVKKKVNHSVNSKGMKKANLRVFPRRDYLKEMKTDYRKESLKD
jgi:hypothetical protein